MPVDILSQKTGSGKVKSLMVFGIGVPKFLILLSRWGVNGHSVLNKLVPR